MSEVTVHGPLIIRLVERLFPLRQTLPEGTSLEELKRKYLKWERINALEYLVLAVGNVFAMHAALLAYAASRTGNDPSAVFTLRPDSEFWYFPAALTGCAIAGFLVRVLNNLMFPDGAREFRIFSNVNAKFDALRMFAAMGVLCLACGALLSYFAAMNELVLRQNDMVLHRLWSMHQETYPYSAIAAIKDIHNAQNNTDVFEIDFAQGQPLSTQVELIYFTPAQLAFLVQQSGKPIQQLAAQ